MSHLHFWDNARYQIKISFKSNLGMVSVQVSMLYIDSHMREREKGHLMYLKGFKKLCHKNKIKTRK